MSGGLRVAVTGAGGYLGRPLVLALAADDRVGEIVAIDLRPPAASAKVRPVRRDIRDPELTGDLEGADAVYHLAFRVLGRGGDADSVNVEGSRNALEAVDRSGARTLIYTSSAAAYGCAPDNPVPLTEQSPLRPVPDFYYPKTKVAVEAMLDDFERRHPETRVVRFRPVATLGPGAPLALGGRAFIVLSDYDPLIQFTWIDDVVDAFVAALFSPASGAFNLGAPGPVRTSEVPALLGIRALRAPHRVLRFAARFGGALRLPGGLHPGWADMARYPIVVDTARAEAELGWRASCDCSEALRRFGAELTRERDGHDLAATDESTSIPSPEEAA